MELKERIKKELINEQQGGVQVPSTIIIASCECVDWANWDGVTPLQIIQHPNNIQPQPGQWILSGQFGNGGCNSGNSYAGTVQGGFPKTVNGNPPQVGDKVKCTGFGGMSCQWAGPSQCYVILYVHTDLVTATGNYQTCTNSCGPIPGCTDSNAFNHDPNATQDDGSCDYGWRCGQLPGGGAIAEQVSMPTGCMPGTATNVGVFPTEAFCLSQNTNIPNGCGGTSMGAKVKPIEPIGVDVKIKDTEIDLEKEPLRKRIKEQLKDIEIKKGSRPEKGSRPDRKHTIAAENPQLPNYGSNAATPYYLCTNITHPHGHGNACYECVGGVLTSPLTGAQAQCPCVPWHQGGNCYGYKQTSDIPSNLSSVEKACSPNCLAS